MRAVHHVARIEHADHHRLADVAGGTSPIGMIAPLVTGVEVGVIVGVG